MGLRLPNPCNWAKEPNLHKMTWGIRSLPTYPRRDGGSTNFAEDEWREARGTETGCEVWRVLRMMDQEVLKIVETA